MSVVNLTVSGKLFQVTLPLQLKDDLKPLPLTFGTDKILFCNDDRKQLSCSTSLYENKFLR